MAEVEFNYNSIKTIIQCDINEKMIDIFNKYIVKIRKDKNEIYFIYDGNKIEENKKDIKFNELANKVDKERKKMNILVNEISINKEEKNRKELEEIICNKCGENIRIKIDNYRIKLFGCKNGHEINNISFEEFEEIEKIDDMKIICDKCKEVNKGNTYENIFYRCNTCKMNICPLC